ncbi:carboxypeptidase regulatory-like domain-containing protein [Rubrivirga sp. IMCC45206]|uniref:carboxypeptidase regulatory-like domain-containing protein n=1 Tax=Rubrivirga sp. IMCC45206 TaxID=3391614 RepID=UPI0039902D8E
MLGDPCNAKKTVTRPELFRYNLFKGLTFAALSLTTLGLAVTTDFAEGGLFGSEDGASGVVEGDGRTDGLGREGLEGGLLAPGALATVTGQLINATTGGPLPGGEVCLQGTSRCAVSDGDGRFTLGDLAADEEVTLTGSADGYFDGSATVELTAGGTTPQNVTLSPVVTGETTRIVLTWDTDRDIDTYLRIPSDGASAAQFISYQSQGDADRFPFATLDVDDTDGLGPETVTIDSRLGGVYGYVVHDYSGQHSLSDATVRVYTASGLVAEFTGPAEPTDYWHVFNLYGDVGAVEPVDRPIDALPDVANGFR